ncbi:MAG: dihydroorotase [Bacteroidales bacterium]|nr:dihydroorotase [Bacteroidales bacterium]
MAILRLIKNASIVNEGEIFNGSILIKDGLIVEIYRGNAIVDETGDIEITDASGRFLLPGVIDDQVHFREPGLTHKATIETESKAAVAGGVTSYMEMPNTIPQTTTNALLEKKFETAAASSYANFSFYLGATNNNLEELLNVDRKNVCGVKVFLGASTGNMLVDDPVVLDKIFSSVKSLIAVHSESEPVIRKNTEIFRRRFGEDVPVKYHPQIRSQEACYESSRFATDLARKYGTRLHLLHLSTAKELGLLDNTIPLDDKRITAEVCVHHLWFCDNDYEKLGNFIKWNPAIKTRADRDELFAGLLDNRLDVVATDHAPHTLEEKGNTYFKAPSGGPLVQHSLQVMLEFYHQNRISLEKIVEKMCHAPARLFKIDRRGFIRKGYYADLVLVDLHQQQTVNKDNILYKCGWSPFEGHIFGSTVTHTFVNGFPVFHNGIFDERIKGKRLVFGS